MKLYTRTYPLFSLCGLNCGLCPRYQTEGSSKCPGCGGPDFHLKHPSCPVITCSRKHDNVEYCFQCRSYPCERYKNTGTLDSFITYKNVLADLEKAERDLDAYKSVLTEKIMILEKLVKTYNDGRKKNYYCIAVNLLELVDVKNIMKTVESDIDNRDISHKDKIHKVIEMFEEKAKKNKIDITLRRG
ncbi:MAG: DUF3795 domain-containing protein [Spirochaetales bacterium]|nr:DUF3795 domain-containing protein [Spirochaetales bacterium]